MNEILRESSRIQSPNCRKEGKLKIETKNYPRDYTNIILMVVIRNLRNGNGKL